MKKISGILSVIIAVVILAGCGEKKAGSDSFIIQGKLENSKKDSVYLKELTVKGNVGIDSAIVSEDGEFYFKVKPKEIGLYLVKLNAKNYITLLIDKGETIEFAANAKDMLSSYTVSGSKGSELIKELNIRLNKTYDLLDSLKKVYDESKGKPNILEVKAALDSIYKAAFNAEKAYLKKFMDKNSGSLACLIALYQYFGREMVFSYNLPDDFIYFEKLDKALLAAYPNNEHAKDLHKRVADVKKMAEERKLAEQKVTVGAFAPDFALETPQGNKVSLSSLKGKIVLIDFWASWCAPCRAENPNMVKLYYKYMAKNFTILGVSLDRDKDAWTNAIKTDKLAWTQVSDLKYWGSPIVQLYNVQSIPFSVLIDKDGKIVAKGLMADSLAMKVGELVLNNQ